LHRNPAVRHLSDAAQAACDRDNIIPFQRPLEAPAIDV
jgi:hypothetical protein